MTAQIADRLIHEGLSLLLHAEPLGDWFALAGEPESPFESQSSANWRGYVAAWEVSEGRLYLVDLRGTLKNGQPGSIDSVFPGYSQRVFAHWVGGRLKAPRGERLQYVHMGYESRYEEDVLIALDRGVVQQVDVRKNVADADRRSSGRFLSDVAGVVSTAVRAALRRDAPTEDPAMPLLHRTNLEEVEARETVADPLAGAPRLPFGHLNARWESFKRSVAPDAEIWSYRETRTLPWGTQETRSGYAAVRGGAISSLFLGQIGRRDAD